MRTLLLIASSVVGLAAAWPGSELSAVAISDDLGRDISGLVAVGADEMLAVRDAPGELVSLERTDGRWGISGPSRALLYPDGSGSPDAEGVTISPDGTVYVVAERDNSAPAESRNSVLAYRIGGTGPLVAEQEWSLDELLGPAAVNRSLEAVAWLPRDVALDDLAAEADALLAVGLEDHDEVHLLALGDETAQLVGSLPTGLGGAMALEWHSESRELWALCHGGCGSRLAVLNVVDGELKADRSWEIPAPPGSDLEGLALPPSCEAGVTTVRWSDEDAADGHALLEATIACGSDRTIDSSAVAPPQDIDAAGPEIEAGDSTGGGLVGAVLAGALAVGVVAAIVWRARHRHAPPGPPR